MVKPNPNRIVVYAQQGLGDHILSNGLYRELSRRHDLILLPVVSNNYKSVKRMLLDIPNLKCVSYNREFFHLTMNLEHRLLTALNYEVIPIGPWHGIRERNKNVNFDEDLYLSANIDFRHRWDSFSVERDLAAENRLKKKLDIGSKPYIFLHEDASRRYQIDRNRIPDGYQIVEPIHPSHEVSFFDYIGVILNAEEIHCIESSFCALIESLDLNQKKVAHRYARPEARTDTSRSFTYKSSWKIEE